MSLIAQERFARTHEAIMFEGEVHGINEYQDALKNERIDLECKKTVRTRLLGRCHRHIEELNRLIGVK